MVYVFYVQNITPAREVVEMVWRQRDLAVQDERKRPKPKPKPGKRSGTKTKARTGRRKTQPMEAIDVPPVGKQSLGLAKRFEWERAMAMMGGWKLSLT